MWLKKNPFGVSFSGDVENLSLFFYFLFFFFFFFLLLVAARFDVSVKTRAKSVRWAARRGPRRGPWRRLIWALRCRCHRVQTGSRGNPGCGTPSSASPRGPSPPPGSPPAPWWRRSGSCPSNWWERKKNTASIKHHKLTMAAKRGRRPGMWRRRQSFHRNKVFD